MNYGLQRKGSGIYKFHRNGSGSFVQDFHITSSDGLPNDIVFDFTFGKGRKVWIITLAGLASVQFYTAGGKENFAITKYGEDDGFRNTTFLYSSLVTDNNGNIWLTTKNYIAQIHSDQVLNDTIPPIIHIENVTLFNSNTEWGKYAKLHLFSSKTLYCHITKMILPLITKPSASITPVTSLITTNLKRLIKTGTPMATILTLRSETFRRDHATPCRRPEAFSPAARRGAPGRDCTCGGRFPGRHARSAPAPFGA